MRITRAIPLSIKILFVMSVVGAASWMAQEQLQNRRISALLKEQLEQSLREEARRSLAQLEEFLRNQVQVGRLFAAQERFQTYIQQRAQSGWGRDGRLISHRRIPEWLPPASLIRNFSRHVHFLLLDGQYRIWETYSAARTPLPLDDYQAQLLDYLRVGGPSGAITSVGGLPHYLASVEARNGEGALQAVLVLVAPLNSEFLSTFNRRFDQHGVQVFLRHESGEVMASSDPTRVAPGERISALTDRYVLVERDFFNYEFSSEMSFQVATLAPLETLASLQDRILESDRRQIGVSIAVYFAAFFLTLLWISRKLQLFGARIVQFARNDLGISLGRLRRGDRLIILEELLDRFTEEIAKSRASLTRELRERKLAEARARESQARYRGLAEEISDWLWELDANGRFTYVSPRVEEMLGMAPETLLGRSPFDLMPEAEAERTRMLLAPQIGARARLESFVSTLRANDGRSVILETNGEPRFDESGVFTGYRGISRDVTRRQHIEASIRHIKNRLEIEERKRLGNLLHESIGQSLQAIKLGLQMKAAAKGAGGGEEPYRLELQEIDEAIGQLRDVTTALRPSFLERMELEQAIRWWCDRVSLNAPQVIDFTAEGALDGLDQEFKYNLFRIFQESLTNALKHARASHVEVALTSSAAGEVTLMVKDDGRGADLKQVMGSLDRGLGLSIIQEQAQRLGGEARFDAAPGAGMTVWVKATR
ncbi:PAS domain-containing sensor histidine kinase [Magnetofaba australis]|uniref:histidine kinase n=1 Tax=Magnetofaba australis IT-1 TaxID=1434232 RepID=A0A1Y2K694_9PROT|nr:PAS domain S-box protein [Magnetofaba australis]OSM05192.1 putative PAS/PAC sensor hybrid histidine kinase [Magnetofaba australis IT-1]